LRKNLLNLPLAKSQGSACLHKSGAMLLPSGEKEQVLRLFAGSPAIKYWPLCSARG
jgi:23S rRNA (cytidine1920-2'-O)/16S rRNA (cytidine1409-2'-O)-methyltransferase